MNHNFFAVIPARKNSKGIPRKNLQTIGSKPMIQFTFEAALSSELIDYTILSSDDKKVIDLARQSGIDAPFIRKKKLSEDNSSTVDVIIDALKWFKINFNYYPKNVVLLQPTSPFRTGDDIDRAIEKYEKTGVDSLVSACEASQHPSECVIVNEKNKIQLIEISKNEKVQGRQGYQKAYFIDGGIYISSVEKILKEKTLFSESSELYFSKKSHAIDIDDEYDLELARAIFHHSEKTNIMDL